MILRGKSCDSVESQILIFGRMGSLQQLTEIACPNIKLCIVIVKSFVGGSFVGTPTRLPSLQDCPTFEERECPEEGGNPAN